MPGGLNGKKSAYGGRTSVRVVVVGDKGTGKSSLIAATASETFPDNVPRLLPPTHLPDYFYPDLVPVTVIDTSSSMENRGKLIEELRRADAVVLTYACDQPITLTRLTSYWLPELRRLEVKVPVIVVGCKLDLRDERHPVSLEQVMAPVMQEFRETETCIECSAATLIQVPDVFFYAQRAVLHPTAPLFDQEKQCLKPRCRRALQRIFTLCDHDMDGALNDAELNEFQVKCFHTHLQPAEIVGVKRVVQEREQNGVNDFGLTLAGFLVLHTLFIEKGRPETAWAVLREFGYNDDLELRHDFLPIPTKRAPDQTVELTNVAIEYLRGVFRLYDIDNDGSLRPSELDDLFQTAPESPWGNDPYKDAVERTPVGNFGFKGFLSEWALMTAIDPAHSLANLIYIGYGRDPSSALSVTRRRSVDRKKQRTERNVFQCFVFGPKKSGKSALLDSFLGRKFSDDYIPTTEERYAANVVEQLGGVKKTLILREIPEEIVKKLLSNKESLAACNVAVFVYDSSDEYSWKRARELLMEVARRGEETGYGMPCLLVAAKDDLDPYPMAVQDSDRVCQQLGMEIPISLSMKFRDPNNVFCRIISTAERPHLSIPETEAGRNRKYYRQLVSSSLIFVSVAAAVGVTGLAAYRTYTAKKNA
ncbi:mitochondrial Rho GTPase 2 isoform X2 [Carica papaya]|uniref:mitochondrial Rho GTPase 2 isoform X2 n=1 Tax=Carica papaya TaxID=3649 RepID=UPI000B8C95AC|nr:mitochondrial Rho GTPase 2 isoform X2 [Carica papaya]